MTLSPDDARLLLLGRQRVPTEPRLAAAWYRLLEGIEGGMLGADTLPALIEAVAEGGEWGVEELHVGAETWGDPTVVVSFVQFAEPCDRAGLVAALRDLLTAWQGPTEAGRAAALNAGVSKLPDPTVAAVTRGVATALFGEQPAPPTEVPADLPAELKEALALGREVARRLREGQSLEGLPLEGLRPGLTPADVARLGALTERLTAFYTTQTAADPGSPARMADALQRWLQGDASAGPALDAAVKALEATTAGITSPDPARVAEEEAARMRADARSRIAGSLRGFGFS